LDCSIFRFKNNYFFCLAMGAKITPIQLGQ
jgi:hypothetical protein